MTDQKDKKIDDNRRKELSDKYVKQKDRKDLPEGDGSVYKGYIIGISLFSHILIGLFFGIGLDKFFDTEPLFILIFILLGFIAGMWQIYRESS
ncbi:MAG: AtpZ/AtpI family protein, partial [Proteobacteria bacterium]|nr:AtpZ/AtpI family protein [Pseudomonadota bacterium]